MNQFKLLPLTITQVTEEPIDQDFTVPDTMVPDNTSPDNMVPDNMIPDNMTPDNMVPDNTIPDFTFPDRVTPETGGMVPAYDELDPEFSVTPSVIPIRPDFFPPFVPTPNIPCLYCSNNQWVRGGVRFLNAATNHNSLIIYIDNRQVYSGLNFSEITRYQQIRQGNHTITVTGSNGFTLLRKTLYIGDGMTTIAIINAASGLDLTSIADTTCQMAYANACFRLSNLAYYSGPINASLGNLYFNAINFTQTTSSSSVRAGSYPLTISRSVRPGTPVISTSITLAPMRIYTLYVMNWNQSPDAIRTLLVEDRRN